MGIAASGSPVGTTAVPDYSRGGAGGRFIPEVWSGKLVEKFYDATVLAAISNTDYEGEIKAFGDTVKIRTVPDVTIADYERGMDLAVQRPTSTPVDLSIDKAKYFNAYCDDADKVQADIQMLDKWSQDASEKMKIAVDTTVLATIDAGVAAANKGATAGAVTGNIDLGTAAAPLSIAATDALSVVLYMAQVLDEQNIPETDRFLVIPFWLSTYLKLSELGKAYLTGDPTTPMRNGRLGIIDRFTVYMSNLLPSSGSGATKQWTMFAGHKSGLTFAGQLTETEKLRSERTFADIIRGLMIFGSKVVNGKNIASAVVTRG